MTFEQASLLILLVAMLALFLMDRFRIEVVAIAGLLAGYALGLYPVDQVFAGAASPVVITVVEILLVVQVLARTRLFDRLSGILAKARLSNSGIIAILSAATGFISIFMNNIGAFSIALPVALRVSAIVGIPKRQLVMPISFAALLGGLVSLIGTPANLIVSDALSKATGVGLPLFDFAYVGLPVAIAGIALTAWLAPRLFPGSQDLTAAAPPGRRMVAERRVPANSPLIGTHLSELPDRFSLRPYALIRNDVFVFGAPGKSMVEASDLLFAEADDTLLDELAASGALAAAHPGRWQTETTRIEAVVMPESTLVGSRLRSLDVFASRDVSVTALSMRSPRVEGRFHDLQLSIGDVVVLEGAREAIMDALDECECLPLASPAAPSHAAGTWQPFAIFACGIAATAFGIVRPDIALAGVVLALALFNYLNIRQAMADLNWPIIIMLAAMIPIGSAVATTGTGEMIAATLSLVVPVDKPLAGLALILFLAMALTPFVNNATVAIILSPIAMEFASVGHHAPEAYLIAVAAGASLDFLTPFGHHNNTLAMGIGSYRFADFLKAGAPVALASYILSLLLIYVVWL
ncbi:cation transporter [Rhizobium sp. Root1203]|uniref:SLC13 family permease n=1 Tax=Rhizobium sp. Root1203 TaxID=1736427 RepID=UPI00070C1664|nr:SLC13 family permease [Rhizobium sp. Root1203]KQV13563.1 cation transporter [Rhizobium sp. Root1203]